MNSVLSLDWDYDEGKKTHFFLIKNFHKLKGRP